MNVAPFTEYGKKMVIDMPEAQRREEFLRNNGYPVGVDFMTMKPLYWASQHKIDKIKTFHGRKYTNLNDPELFEDYSFRQILGKFELRGLKHGKESVQRM